jgi:Xaa-Pro aminopeptidase
MLTSLRYTIAPSEIELNKAIKNEVEIQGFRNAYLRDGVAMVRWFAWLEEKIRKSEPISEWGAAEKLTEFRAEGELYRGLSGENISASGANAGM